METLIAAIQAAPQEEEKAQLTSKKNKLQLLHPGFTANVWRLDMKQNSWTKDSPIKGLSPVTTTAVRIDNYIIIPTGEIKAGVRTDQILIGNLGLNLKQDLNPNQDLNLKP